jgi:hypothetical protein
MFFGERRTDGFDTTIGEEIDRHREGDKQEFHR